MDGTCRSASYLQMAPTKSAGVDDFTVTAVYDRRQRRNFDIPGGHRPELSKIGQGCDRRD